MSLSQAKIDLAVLYKLHQHAEGGGEAIPPEDILREFQCHISLRRVELALEALDAKGDVEREYHPFYSEVGLWQVSREGLEKVDRALRVPASFIARLHTNGDHWLETDEAKQAVLKKLSEHEGQHPTHRDIPVVRLDKVIALPVSKSIDWTKWGTIIGAVGVLVTLVLWMLS